MNFSLTSEQTERLNKFVAEVEAEVLAYQLENFTGHKLELVKQLNKPYSGAIGGSLTYSFTPTSLGIITKVKCWGKEIDLTDYDNW